MEPKPDKKLTDIIQRLTQEENRWSAVLELKVHIHHPKWIPELITYLSHPDWVVRWTVAEKLGDLRSEAALTHLIKLFSDPDSHVRKNAVKALQKYKLPAVPILIDYLDHPHVEIRKGVSDILMGFSELVLPEFEHLIPQKNWVIANRLLQLTWLIEGARSEALLIRCLDIPDIQKTAIVLLGTCHNSQAVKPLLKLCVVPGLRKLILHQFSKMGAPLVFPILVISAVSNQASLKEGAVWVILKIGKPVIPYLSRAAAQKGASQAPLLALIQKIDPESLKKKHPPSDKGFLGIFKS